ncbi:hypothetical protein J6590_092343 [Homalodisca vitripennis]|nr:hypothetical protein J6590_092343 [Homalodisca vitripennis]
MGMLRRTGPPIDIEGAQGTDYLRTSSVPPSTNLTGERNIHHRCVREVRATSYYSHHVLFHPLPITQGCRIHIIDVFGRLEPPLTIATTVRATSYYSHHGKVHKALTIF